MTDDHGLTRRRLIGGAAGTAAAVGIGAAGYAIGEARADDDAGTASEVPFHGERQAGIATAAQDRLCFAAFDVTVEGAAELQNLLRTWTDAAARMTAGKLVGDGESRPLRPPDDTGEAEGLPPAQLTVTFGLGPSLFEKGRFGIDGRRPAALQQIPILPGDEIDADRSYGDIAVQACSNDPQVAFHAVRNLARIARGTAVMRWSQLGFGRTSTTTRAQSTPRNLMGFKDGTNNIRAEDTKDMDRFVWAKEPAWLAGGTYMVTRRIRMLIESWDRTNLGEQERVIGRAKVSGAPLGEQDEFDEVPLDSKKIDVDAHIRLAAPSVNDDIKLLRRGYSFTDGTDPQTGQLDAGLFFIAFTDDPANFVEVQRRLGGGDALNEYIKHVSSAVFAVPPGIRPGGFVGEGLFRR